MAFDDEERRRGLTFRNRGPSAVASLLGGGDGRVVIQTPGGTSAVPGVDMQIYEAMAEEVARLDALASEMNRLTNKDETTRDLMRKMRLLSVELRGELERRITG